MTSTDTITTPPTTAGTTKTSTDTATETTDQPAAAPHRRRVMTHLDTAAQVWDALTCDPRPLSLDCDALGRGLNLPRGEVALPVLRSWMLKHPRAYAERDAVWRELASRARLHRQPWRIAAVGMAMPGLVRSANSLAQAYTRVARADIDAEILTGFLEALTNHVDLAKPALYASLGFAAYRAGLAMCQAEAGHLPVADVGAVAAGARVPRLPYAHPDLLVLRAQALGLIDAADVDAYIDVRLGRRAIEPIAYRLGVSVDTLRMRLSRIDNRLVAALADGELTGVVCAQAVAYQRARTDRTEAARTSRAAARSRRHRLDTSGGQVAA